MKFVTFLYIISLLKCSCYASSLSNEDHPYASGIHIRVLNRVLTKNGDRSCSHSVVNKNFHISLAPEDDNVINHDVVTDSQGNTAAYFQLDSSKGLPTIARLTLCAAAEGEHDNNDTHCAVREIKSSDFINKLVMNRDNRNALEVIIYVRWCMDTLTSEVIGENDFSEGRIYNRQQIPDVHQKYRHGMEQRPENNAHVVNMQTLKNHHHNTLNSDPVKFRRKRANYPGKSSGSASSFRRPFDMSDPQNFKRTWGERNEVWPTKRLWGDSGEAWLKRNDDKRIWGDSGEAWLKRNDDKRIWGDSGEAWLKRNDEKRLWGDSGEAWLKRDGTNRSPEQELPPEADLMNDDKRAWGDDGMAWVKRSEERR